MAPLQDCPDLVAALHPLDAPPSMPGWNQDELLGLLPAGRDPMPAAVLVGLVPRAAGTQVLLTRRTDALRHHAGQVSFPGGRVEPGDRDAASAALRETEEELGIAPSRLHALGYLDPLLTITGFRVLPVVALVDADYVARPDPGEVADVFEVPLAFLLDPENLVAQPFEWQGRMRTVWEYRYPSQRIWGATASMLLNLRNRLENVR